MPVVHAFYWHIMISLFTYSLYEYIYFLLFQSVIFGSSADSTTVLLPRILYVCAVCAAVSSWYTRTVCEMSYSCFMPLAIQSLIAFGTLSMYSRESRAWVCRPLVPRYKSRCSSAGVLTSQCLLVVNSFRGSYGNFERASLVCSPLPPHKTHPFRKVEKLCVLHVSHFNHGMAHPEFCLFFVFFFIFVVVVLLWVEKFEKTVMGRLWRTLINLLLSK